MDPEHSTDRDEREELVDLRGRVAALEAELARARRDGIWFERVSERAADELDSGAVPVLVEVDGLVAGDRRDPRVTVIEGENLFALDVLARTHHGFFDVIYIDPPYNTGRTDLAYNDSFGGEGSSGWLSFMERRLRAAEPLLADDGFVAVSIDDNSVAQLKMLMAAVFGAGSVLTVVVKMSELAGVKMAAARRAGTLPKVKEYVLIAKRGGVRGLRLRPVRKESWGSGYTKLLSGFTVQMRERIAELRARGKVTAGEVADLERLLAPVSLVSARRVAADEGVDVGDRAALDAWRYANAWRIVGTTNGAGNIRGLVAGRRSDGSLPSQEVVPVRTPTGLLYLALVSNGYTVLLADEHLDTIHGDLWTDVRTTGLSAEGGVRFLNGKKPLALLSRIIDLHPNDDAAVLDFFAGSGSTGHAVAELNAQHGGARTCVLVTDNSGLVDGRFVADAGDAGICRSVTLPRLRGVVSGERPDGKASPPRSVSLTHLRVELDGRPCG